ncbi:MAG: hypothetical protein JWO82_3533, partial [Akkermansiaceae bacterium]|nr:hypothetical protein [Akkermansiaceae bacterium]
WMYGYMAGIDFDQTTPGYKKLLIHPRPGGTLTSASGKLNTINGTVSTSWMATANNFVLNTTIPVNATAKVYVPTTDAATVLESGVPAATVPGISYLGMEDGAAVYSVPSGRYQFTSNSNEVPGTDSVTRAADGSVTVSLGDLLANDGDGATFYSADTVSVDGAAITVAGGSIYYVPIPGHTGADSFTYLVKNASGGIEVRTVNVAALTVTDPAQTVVTTEMLADGSYHVVFSGVVGKTYRIWSSEDMAGEESWTLRATVTADSNGKFELLDSPPLPEHRFYRSTFP